MTAIDGRYEYLDAVTLHIFKDSDDEFTVTIDTVDMTAVAECGPYAENQKRVYYKINASHETLTEDERRKILDSTLGEGSYNPTTERVTAVDLFLQGDFVTVTKVEDI